MTSFLRRFLWIRPLLSPYDDLKRAPNTNVFLEMSIISCLKWVKMSRNQPNNLAFVLLQSQKEGIKRDNKTWCGVLLYIIISAWVVWCTPLQSWFFIFNRMPRKRFISYTTLICPQLHIWIYSWTCCTFNCLELP